MSKCEYWSESESSYNAKELRGRCLTCVYIFKKRCPLGKAEEPFKQKIIDLQEELEATKLLLQGAYNEINRLI
jgi:hypothetical protein